MNFLFCVFLLLLIPAWGATHEASILYYGDINTLGALPLVGGGIRYQYAFQGMRLSVNACPVAPLRVYHVSGLYLLYPKKTHFYLGAGIGMIRESELLNRSTGSLEASLGWEKPLNTKRCRIFFEINAIIPIDRDASMMRLWPGLTIGYGV